MKTAGRYFSVKDIKRYCGVDCEGNLWLVSIKPSRQLQKCILENQFKHLFQQ